MVKIIIDSEKKGDSVKKSFVVLLLLANSYLGAEALKTEVIPDHTIGLELNPFRFLISNEEWQSLSGTLAYFNNENGTEIAMPFYYSREKDNFYDENYEEVETVVNIGLHYRKYFSGNQTNGAYLGAFGRYTYLDGKVWDKPLYATVHKFGIGAEVGVRVKRIFDTPFYWGASLALGGHLSSDNDIFEGSGIALGMDDNKMIIDAELLKVGYEF